MQEEKSNTTASEMTPAEFYVWIGQWKPLKLKFETTLRYLTTKKVKGPHACAIATIDVLRNLMGVCRWNTAEEIMRIVKAAGKELVSAAPFEITIDNMVRRVLFIVRDEYAGKLRDLDGTNNNNNEEERKGGRGLKSWSSFSNDEEDDYGEDEEDDEDDEASKESTDQDSVEEKTYNTPPKGLGAIPLTRTDSSLSRADGVDPTIQFSMDKFLTPISESSSDFSISVPDLRHHTLEAVSVLINEVESVSDSICEQALDHIHAQEVILTHGYSSSVAKFLKSAGERISFSVLVTEAEPTLSSRRLVEELSEIDNISITVVPDASAFAVMGRVTKMIIGCHTVLADGGIVGNSGVRAIVRGAKEANVPVFCVTALFKISPLYSHNLTSLFAQTAPPYHLVSQEEGLVGDDDIDVVVSVFDHVPPELVDLFITDQKCHQPSYIYRLLGEFYHTDDNFRSY